MHSFSHPSGVIGPPRGTEPAPVRGRRKGTRPAGASGSSPHSTSMFQKNGTGATSTLLTFERQAVGW
jgi:hypothetical protein